MTSFPAATRGWWTTPVHWPEEDFSTCPATNGHFVIVRFDKPAPRS
jgi:hypothetical protein